MQLFYKTLKNIIIYQFTIENKKLKEKQMKNSRKNIYVIFLILGIKRIETINLDKKIKIK